MINPSLIKLLPARLYHHQHQIANTLSTQEKLARIQKSCINVMLKAKPTMEKLMAVDIEESKKDILLIEENWDSIINMLESFNKDDPSSVLDFTFLTGENRPISINRAHKRINRIRTILEGIEIINEEDIALIGENNITSIIQHIQGIASQSTKMEAEIQESMKHKARDLHTDTNRFIISYINTSQQSQPVDIRQHISNMLASVNHIIKIDKNKIYPFKIEDASAILKQAKKQVSKELNTAKEESKESLQVISQTLKESKKALGQIEKNREVIDNLAKSASEDASKVIISNITKELLKKRNTSKAQLTKARNIYVGVLFGLAVLTFILHFCSKSLGLPEINNFIEYIITRILFIFPYALLIVLALRNYNLAVRRNEYYEAKFVVASLIDGFKDKVEEQEYKDAVNATVFSELLIESADYVDGAKKRKREKESLLERLVDKLEDRSKGAVKVIAPQYPTPPKP